MKRLLAVLAFCLFALTACPATQPGDGSDGQPSYTGISAGANLYRWASQADKGRAEFDAMVAGKVRYIRLDVSCGEVTFPQGVIQAARNAGLLVDAILLDWHTQNTSEISSCATSAANLYTPMGVNIYEVGNEVNPAPWTAINPAGTLNGHEHGGPYKTDLCAAYNALKAANGNAFVLMAGMQTGTGSDGQPGHTQKDFLTELYQASGANCFDAVNMHPYSCPAHPMENVNYNAFYHLPDLKAIIDYVGDTKRVWLTEYGVEVNPAPNDSCSSRTLTDTQQANDIRDAYAQVHGPWASWTGPLFTFQWQDSGDGTWGMRTSSGGYRPAWFQLVGAGR